MSKQIRQIYVESLIMPLKNAFICLPKGMSKLTLTYLGTRRVLTLQIVAMQHVEVISQLYQSVIHLERGLHITIKPVTMVLRF